MKSGPATQEVFERPYQPPTTSGWQILQDVVKVANAVMPTEADFFALHVNLYARRDEDLPREQMPQIVNDLIEIAKKYTDYYQPWPDHITLFLHAQIGKSALSLLLEGTESVIVDCDGDCEIGYHIMRWPEECDNSSEIEIIIYG